MEKNKLIKMCLWILLILFLLWLLFMMFLKEYADGYHLIYYDECINDVYNCTCNNDNGQTCECYRKKLWIEYKGTCDRNLLNDSQIVKQE